jgi:hypothetical protein
LRGERTSAPPARQIAAVAHFLDEPLRVLSADEQDRLVGQGTLQHTGPGERIVSGVSREQSTTQEPQTAGRRLCARARSIRPPAPRPSGGRGRARDRTDTPSCAAHRQGSTLGTTAGRGLAARIPLREERFRVRPLAQAARTGAHCLLRPGDCTSVSRSRASRLAAGHTGSVARPLCRAGCVLVGAPPSPTDLSGTRPAHSRESFRWFPLREIRVPGRRARQRGDEGAGHRR